MDCVGQVHLSNAKLGSFHHIWPARVGGRLLSLSEEQHCSYVLVQKTWSLHSSTHEHVSFDDQDIECKASPCLLAYEAYLVVSSRYLSSQNEPC
jgi:hypothetical protein